MYYLRWPGKNFGDMLNDIIFPKYRVYNSLPYNKGTLKSLPENTFLGLGTLLAKKLSSPVHVVGTGSSWGAGLGANVTFHFVRGPYTAKRYGVTALGDTAYAITDWVQEQAMPTHRAGTKVIPHHSRIKQFQLDEMPLPDNWIDPTQSVEKFIAEVNECSSVLCEAMHGAICADQIRVPWAPVMLGPGVEPYKWHDWSKQLGIDIVFGGLGHHYFYLSSDSVLDKVSSDVEAGMEEAVSIVQESQQFSALHIGTVDC